MGNKNRTNSVARRWLNKKKRPVLRHSNRYIALPGQELGERSVSKAGMINAYVCANCGKLTVVRHIHSGVTPMFLACRNPFCEGGRATSMMYPNPPYPKRILEGIQWEWYRPGWEEFEKLEPAMKQHVLDGGLVLREAP